MHQIRLDVKNKAACISLSIILKWRNTFEKSFVSEINPHTPIAQKVVDEMVFRRFQGKGVEFFLIGPHWPPSDFLCGSFGKYQFKLFQLSFFSWCLCFAGLAMNQRWSAIFRATGVWWGKPIGRMRLNMKKYFWKIFFKLTDTLLTVNNNF